MTEKTSLAYINDVADREIKAQRSTVSYENISGFEIAVKHDIDLKHESNRVSFAADSNAVQQKLSKAGIEALAIIPTSWWNKIVEDTGMLNMHPSKDGFVYMNAKSVSKKVDNTLSAFFVFVSWLAICGAATFAAASQFFYMSLLTIVVAVIISAVCGVVSYGILHSVLFQKINIALYVKINGKKALYEEMLSKDYYQQQVQVSFPTPPEDVAEILSKARNSNLDLRIASVEEAVAFSPSFGQVIAREIKDEQRRVAEARRQRILNALRDPIVFIEHGSAVGIIAQFGEFPIEKSVVDQVVSSKL